jgi:hypothetical protein
MPPMRVFADVDDVATRQIRQARQNLAPTGLELLVEPGEVFVIALEAELVRIHGNDERVSVETFRRGVSDLLAIIGAVVYDWGKPGLDRDHCGVDSAG